MFDFEGLVQIGSQSGLFLSGCVIGLAAAFRLMRFPDITVEGSFLLGASVWCALLKAGLPFLPACAAGLLAAAVAGATTGALVSVFRIDRFLAGILVTASCYSIALTAMGASNVGLLGVSTPIGEFEQKGMSWQAAGSVALLCTTAALLFFISRAGLRARAASINPQFLIGTGHWPAIYMALGLAAVNCLSGFAGIAFASHQGFVDVGMGQGILIVSLASLAIGEAITRWFPIPPVPKALISAILGSILYQIAVSAALFAGLPATLTKLVTAAFVFVFLVLNRPTSDKSEV